MRGTTKMVRRSCMMALQSKADRPRPDSAADELANNSEQALWAAHVRTAQLLDDEPGPVARNILNAVDERWRRAFLEAGDAV